MPIYEYQCQACGKHFEEMQKITDEPLKLCPNCGKETLQKLVSHTSFQLKGGGYYATDYKKPSAEKAAEKTENKPQESTNKAKENEPKDKTTDSKTTTESTKSSEKKSE